MGEAQRVFTGPSRDRIVAEDEVRLEPVELLHEGISPIDDPHLGHESLGDQRARLQFRVVGVVFDDQHTQGGSVGTDA